MFVILLGTPWHLNKERRMVPDHGDRLRQRSNRYGATPGTFAISAESCSL